MANKLSFNIIVENIGNGFTNKETISHYESPLGS